MKIKISKSSIWFSVVAVVGVFIVSGEKGFKNITWFDAYIVLMFAFLAQEVSKYKSFSPSEQVDIEIKNN